MSSRLDIICNHLGQTKAEGGEAKVYPYLSDPLGLLKLDELLPSNLNTLRKSLREVLDKEIAPLLPDYIERAEFPMKILPKLKPFFGTTEGGYNTKKLSPLEIALSTYEIARVDCSLATFFLMTIDLIIFTIEKLGSEEQKAKYLPALCNLDMIGCWGLTEPDFGSDASSLKATATPVDGGFVINGEKRWIGNASISDIMVIWARNTSTNQIEGFLVPTKSQGVSVDNITRKYALRMVQNGNIHMKNVKVSINDRMPKATNFNNGANVVLGHSRMVVPWAATGAMAGAYESAIKYVSERRQFRSPLSAFQINQEKLVRALGYFQAAFLLTLRLTQLQEKGQAKIEQASLVKGWTTYVGREMTKLCRELLGGNGIVIENNVMKFMNDMEALYTYEGSYDINALVTGRFITGIPAFKSSLR